MSSMLRKVVVVGGGTAGWMSAAALTRAFGRNLEITLIESDAIGTVGVGEATIPQIKVFNQFLGLDENAFLKSTQGSFKLGIQFNDWGRIGDSYIHAFGDIGAPLGVLPFHHYWLRARAEGEAGALHDYSLNNMAALANRFDRLQQIPNTRLNGLAYAFHFDAMLYAKTLRAYAEERGVLRREGKVSNVSLDGETGFIASLELESGDKIDGDLFIDCSGFRGLLIEEALEAGYDDWTHWLPCDRAVAVPCKHGDIFRPYTQATAQKAGWQWRIPLQHRVGNGHVYCSSHLSDDEATSTLLQNIEGEALAEPRILRFATGMRKRFWVKNCIAVGLASGFMEPLESTSIHLVQSAISRLFSMFPTRNYDGALIEEYNRQTRFEYERIRDFLILHYHANKRDDSDFWKACRAMEIPETLKHKIALFEASGRIYREHEELFTETGWLQVLIGQNIEPTQYHPLADMISTEDLNRFLSDIKTLVARTVRDLPDHRAFIDNNCAAAS